jgi:putative inorganic carbon (HCO3(-)) transporter
MKALPVDWRNLLLAAMPVTALTVSPRGLDSVNLPQAVGLVVEASTVTAGWLLSGRVSANLRRLPRSVFVAVGAFMIASVGAALLAPRPMASLVGAEGRATGAATYLSATALMLLFAIATDARFAERSLMVFAGTTAALFGVGTLQAMGMEPIPQSSLYGPLVGTLGNPNFFSAYLGVGSVALAWVALGRRRPVVRTIAAALWVMVLVMAVFTRSVQGPLIGLGGTGFLVLFTLTSTVWSSIRWRVALGAVSALALVLLLAGINGAGPFRLLQDPDAIPTRLWYWQAAASIAGEHPLTGVGFDGYRSHFREHRPVAAAARYSAQQTADAPHNIPLGMFVSGGLPLGLAYLGLVGVGARALWQGLHKNGPTKALVAAVGGGWLAWHAQSIVSIDTPALIGLHAALMGTLVGLSVDAPIASLPERRRGRRSNRTPWWGWGSAATLLGVGLWLPLAWWSANGYAGTGVRLAAQGLTDGAEAALGEAIERAPWQSRYWAERGRVRLRDGRIKDGQRDFVAALRLEPRNVAYAMTLGRLASAHGRVEDGDRYFELVLRLDPNSPELRAEIADHYSRSGNPARAVVLLQEALALRPEQSDWLLRLASMAEAAGEPALAVKAYQAVLRTQPHDEKVHAALRRLGQEE